MAGKPGKWVAFRKVYDKAPIDASLFDNINTVLDAFAFPAPEGQTQLDHTRVRDLSKTQLKELYVQARAGVDELNAKLSVLNIQVSALTYIFVQRMEEDDVTSYPFTDGVSLGSSVEPYPNVEDRGALYKWIEDTKQGELLTLNWQTLASITKQCILEGKPLPPGVKVFMKDKLTARGLKTKGETNDTASDGTPD